MSCLRRFLFPIWGSLSWATPCSPRLYLSRSTTFGRSGLLEVMPKQVYPESHTYSLTVGRGLHRKIMQCLNHSGKIKGILMTKDSKGSFLAFSVATGMIYHDSFICDADDNYSDIEEPSGFLKDDLHTFWSLTKKFQLPLVLLITILLGWRHPVTLAINVALLLFCTRPNPFSIYMFIEQLRQRDMRRYPSLQKTKYLYVKKVEVEDYKILCLARVELREVKIDVIGILGGWWIFQTSPTRSKLGWARAFIFWAVLANHTHSPSAFIFFYQTCAQRRRVRENDGNDRVLRIPKDESSVCW